MTTENDEAFTCWKEIAAHFGKGVRTVQRWERLFGLPVQRPKALCKGMVRASRKELSEWMQRERSRRAMKPTKSVPANLRDSPTMKSVASMRDLRASNQDLLKQFKESLRLLNTTCEELCRAMRRKDNDETGASVA